MQLQWFIAGGIILVIVVRRFNRIVGSALGMAVAIALGVWGHFAYAEGGGIAFAGIALSEPVFLLLVAIWLAIEAFFLVQSIRRRRTQADALPDEPVEGD